MIEFHPVDFIYSKVRPAEEIRPHFSYKKEFWKPGKYSKTPTSYDSFLIKKNGSFLSGFLPKFEKWCTGQGKEFSSYDIRDHLPPYFPILPGPSLPGITFREDQLRLIESARKHLRGVLKSPTGSGKTVIASGIISMFPKAKVLFLCHTISLIKQTITEFSRFGLGPISQVGSGSKDISGRIVVATMQSFSKIPIEETCDKFDIVIVDESHHVNSFSSTYAKILTSLLVPIRFGFTATLPTTTEGKMALEGLIGPLLDEVSIQEGMDLEFLAKPKVQLMAVPKYTSLREEGIFSYKAIYDATIVSYRKRNSIVMNAVKELNSKGKSAIIYVTQIDHGERLVDIGDRMGVSSFFVRGSVGAEEREQLRKDLQNKKVMCVIATTVWKEGVNVLSVGAIVIAGGGKSELILLQSIGRGFRRDTGKDEIIIVDFIDIGRYISDHFCERLSVYVENGWI